MLCDYVCAYNCLEIWDTALSVSLHVYIPFQHRFHLNCSDPSIVKVDIEVCAGVNKDMEDRNVLQNIKKAALQWEDMQTQHWIWIICMWNPSQVTSGCWDAGEGRWVYDGHHQEGLQNSGLIKGTKGKGMEYYHLGFHFWGKVEKIMRTGSGVSLYKCCFHCIFSSCILGWVKYVYLLGIKALEKPQEVGFHSIARWQFLEN